MDEKARALADLRDIFDRWKALTMRLREPELVAPLHGGLSVKDIIAHLRAWQTVSIARLEAGQRGGAPLYPPWAGSDPDAEAARTDQNARIQEMYRNQPWAAVWREWRAGFLRFMALAEAIPAADLADATRYPWLDGYTLLDVLRGSYEHHREHLEELG